MHHNAEDDFDHPKVAEGHPLKKQVLYRVSQQMPSKKRFTKHLRISLRTGGDFSVRNVD